MIGLLKKRLSICQSGWKEIRNTLPAIRWIRWGPRTRILALVRRCYLPRLNYVCDAGYHTVYARRKTMVCSVIVNRGNLGWTVFGVLYPFLYIYYERKNIFNCECLSGSLLSGLIESPWSSGLPWGQSLSPLCSRDIEIVVLLLSYCLELYISRAYIFWEKSWNIILSWDGSCKVSFNLVF